MGNLECGTGSHRKHHLSRNLQRTLDKQPEREYCSPESGKAWGKHSICGLTNCLIDSNTNWMSLKMTTLWTKKKSPVSQSKGTGVLRQLHWIHSPFWQKATSDDLDQHLPAENYEVKNSGHIRWVTQLSGVKSPLFPTYKFFQSQTDRQTEGRREEEQKRINCSFFLECLL